MISAVNPSSSGFQGGLYAPSGLPTGVGGGGFAPPGTSAPTPSAVPGSGIIEARNNRGSNVRIPYPRLVPLHSRTGYKSLGSNGQEDKRQVLVDGKPALEYDGLRNGELAWILGRRFRVIANDDGNSGALNTNPASQGGGGAAGIDELTTSQRYAHQAYAGLGNGVDRMQRLASTGWVEALIQSKLGSSTVNLHGIQLGSDYSSAMDSGVAAYSAFLVGSTALYTNDVAHSMAVASGNAASLAAVGTRKLQGIFVAEMGPFLRGVQVSSDAIPIREILGTSASQDVARNLGDTLAFSALDAELRRRNLMDWTPDGVVLSKGESPTDAPMHSIEMDARSAQLFNVAVQGPAISTSWTSDVRDYKLECQPMDRVFICLVADLSYSLDAAVDPSVNAALDRRKELDVLLKTLNDEMAKRPVVPATVNSLRKDIRDKILECRGAAKDLVDEANKVAKIGYELKLEEVANAEAVLEAHKNTAPAPVGSLAAWNTQLKDLTKDVSDAKEEADGCMGGWSEKPVDLQAQIDEFKKVQEVIRKGDEFVARAALTNFRLLRSTSSHMANYSQFKPNNPNYRCGLRLGAYDNGDECGCGEYIVGAWCIGTVVDAAASRSTVGTLVRTAPTSMALNIAVNIEWWSGDKLYKHYMDDSGLTLPRGMHSKHVVDSTGTKRTRADADMDSDSVL